MNEHDESERSAPPVFSGPAPALSDVNDMTSDLQRLAVLPAALILANFLPHARETESMPPKRRRLPPHSFPSTNSPGPTGHVYRACCLNTDGPVGPRHPGKILSI